jgi:thiamine biosynthesis lipoprotein
MRIVLAGCLILFSLRTGHAEEVLEIGGRTMGTTYTVKWMAGIGGSNIPEPVQSAVDQRLKQINALMSTYDPESELSRFNRSRSIEWFAVSAETAKVVQRALEVSRMSKGAFDPTVGRLVGLWSFGAEQRSYEPPSRKDIDAALKSVGFRLLEIRLEQPALKKSDPDVCVDLSAIAKGFGVDAVGQLLLDRGIEDFLVEIGGEVLAHGSHIGKPWTLGIEIPSEFREGLAATVPLFNQALATSGNYRNYFEKNGIRYSHTIDPGTGCPVRHTLASASVVMDDCMSADALATAIMVLGPEQGLAFANEHNLPACLLVHDGKHSRILLSNAGKSAFNILDQHEVAVATSGENPGDTANMIGGLTIFLAWSGLIGIAVCGLGVVAIHSNRRLKRSDCGMSTMPEKRGRSSFRGLPTPLKRNGPSGKEIP